MSPFRLHYLPQTLVVVKLVSNRQRNGLKPNDVSLGSGLLDILAVFPELVGSSVPTIIGAVFHQQLVLNIEDFLPILAPMEFERLEAFVAYVRNDQ